MSLKDAINNTNTQKENVKKVATQIDNKLVELGGEQATDLSDVPNKMQYMIGQYKKVAIINLNKTVYLVNTNKENFKEGTEKITLNLNFTPSLIILKFKEITVKPNPSGNPNLTKKIEREMMDSTKKFIFNYNDNCYSALGIEAQIVDMNKDGFSLVYLLPQNEGINLVIGEIIAIG